MMMVSMACSRGIVQGGGSCRAEVGGGWGRAQLYPQASSNSILNGPWPGQSLKQHWVLPGVPVPPGKRDGEPALGIKSTLRHGSQAVPDPGHQRVNVGGLEGPPV